MNAHIHQTTAKVSWWEATVEIVLSVNQLDESSVISEHAGENFIFIELTHGSCRVPKKRALR